MYIVKTKTTHAISPHTKDGLRLLLIFSLWIAFMLLSTHVFAADGTEFQAATDKVEGWIQGQYGRLAALVALGIGALMAALRKDWTWLLGAVALAMGIGLFVGIINSSFAAII